MRALRWLGALLILVSPFLPIVQARVIHGSAFDLLRAMRAMRSGVIADEFLPREMLEKLDVTHQQIKELEEFQQKLKEAPPLPVPWGCYVVLAIGAVAVGLALAGPWSWLLAPSVLWLAGVAWQLVKLFNLPSVRAEEPSGFSVSPWGWLAAFAGGSVLMAAWFLGRRQRQHNSVSGAGSVQRQADAGTHL